MTEIGIANIALRSVGLAALIGVPLTMIATAGTGWFFVVWIGGGIIGGLATMAAEYTEGLTAQ